MRKASGRLELEFISADSCTCENLLPLQRQQQALHRLIESVFYFLWGCCRQHYLQLFIYISKISWLFRVSSSLLFLAPQPPGWKKKKWHKAFELCAGWYGKHFLERNKWLYLFFCYVTNDGGFIVTITF